MNESWRLHLGPPARRQWPKSDPPPPFITGPYAPEHHVLDWRLRVAAVIALLISVIAIGAAG